MRILYVEDTVPNLILVERIVRMGKHEVLNYASAEETLRNFERDSPDLVLVDIRLEGRMDGLEMVRRLRAAGHKMPIIAVTAFVTDGIRERCLAAGCDDYVAKPLPVHTFWRLIQHYDVSSPAKPAPARRAPIAAAKQVKNTERKLPVWVTQAVGERPMLLPAKV